MSTEVIAKANGRLTNEAFGDLVLDQPSLIKIKAGPETVDRFEQAGNDLLIVLKDGTTLTIQNFFVADEDGNRSDLVLEDVEGVHWWGQYTSPWSEFHFAEVQEDHIVAGFIPPAAGLAPWAIAALALIGGGVIYKVVDDDDDEPAPVLPTPSGPPQAPNYQHTIEEDGEATGRIVGTDPDGDTLTYVVTTPPTNGTVVVNPDGSYTYTPDPDYNGPDEFVVTVDDGNGGTTTSTVTIEVTPVNDPPVAVDTIPPQGNEDAETGINVPTAPFFEDVDGDELTYTATGLPPGLSIDPETGLITGTIDPSASVDGPYTVTVTVTDPDGETAEQTFIWNVTNPAPEAVNDSGTGREDTPVTGNVLGNDNDPDGDDLTVTGFTVGGTDYAPGSTATIPNVGTITIGTDGGYTFTPASNYNGTVPPVTYTIDDGEGGTDTAELNIVVTPVNDTPTPVGSIPDQDNEDADIGVNVPTAGFFEDVDDSDLTYSATGLPPGLSIDPDTGVITGTIDPSASVDGPYTVTVTVADPDGETAEQTFTWNVTNPDPVADDDSATTPEDTPVSGNVLTNDSDPDGDDLSVTGFTVDGTDYVAGETATIPGVGTITIGSDGSYTFTPAPNYNGTVPPVTYTVDDGEGGTDTAELNIVVTPDDAPSITPEDGNDDPADPGSVISQGHVTVYESALPDGSGGGTATASGTIAIEADDGVKTVTIGGTTIPLADLEDAATTPVVITTPHGTLTITGYTPNGTDFNGVSTGGDIAYTYELTTPPTNATGNPENFLEEIALAIEDEGGDTTTGTLVVNIIDDLPEATDDAVTTVDGDAAGNVITGIITIGDGTPSDADTAGADGPVTVTAISSDNVPTSTPTGTDTLTIAGEYGTLVIEVNGDYTYTRDPGTPGGADDVFTYTIVDGDGDEVTATLTISLDDNDPGITVPPVDPDEYPGVDLDIDSSLGQVNAIVYESALANGSDPTSDAETTSGQFSFTSPDGVGSVTVGGEDVTGVDAADSSTHVTITTPEGNTLVITGYSYDPATGQGTVEYTYTLIENEDHHDAEGNNSLDDIIAIVVTDGDGDEIDGNLIVRIIDDVPTVAGTDGAPSLEVDESFLGASGASDNATMQMADLFDIVTGADGATTTYVVGVGESSGLIDTASGQAVVLSVSDNDSGLYTVIGTAAGETVLTITINTVTGEFTLDQHRAVRHADDADPDDVVSLAANAITITATVTDGDGDEADATRNLGGSFSFKDDGPSIGTPAGASVNEANLANGSDPNTAALTVTGSLAVNFGADGEGPASDVSFSDTQAPPTGLTYVLSNDEKTLTATNEDAEVVFTVTINANGTYTFVLSGALDHGDVSALDLPFAFTVTDGDGDTDDGSFTVIVVDDAPTVERVIEVDEDGSVTFNTTADANVSLPDEGEPGTPTHGTVTVDPVTGQITYVPDPDYSGEDTFTYTIGNDDGIPTVTTVTVTVNPISDAPTLGDNATVNTVEDEAVTLGLTAPVITDGTDQNDGSDGDNPERLAAITLTIGGAGATGVTLQTGTTVLTPVSGQLTIVLTDGNPTTDVPAHDPAAGVYHMTTDEYEALVANPNPEDGRNFTVTVEVSSYEVGDTGAPISGVPGAPGTPQVITVDVQAVTDGATLELVGSPTAADLTFPEDTALDLSSFLQATLDSTDANAGNDTDGSERYSYSVSGLPEGSVVNINGTNYTVPASGTVTSAESATFTASPSITVTPPANFSGDMTGVTITLHTQDTDGDSTGTITPTDSTVTLNLYVTPVADAALVANPAAGTEDSDIAFLAGISHADRDPNGGAERITEVAFTVPTGWTMTTVPTVTGMTVSGGPTGAVTITFASTMTQEQIEQALDGFTVRPPAHSSLDAEMPVSVTTVDVETVNGTEVTSDPTTVNPTIHITVTPVAERVDGDSDGADGNDVTMTPGHAYTVAGEEDTWYTLGIDDGFNLGTGWSNEDDVNNGGLEQTFAELTPVLTAQDDPSYSVIGTTFRYHDGSGVVEVVYTGPGSVRIPVEFLDTLEFLPPNNVSGTFRIGVQAYTVDYDDDGDGTSVTALSGQAYLDLITINPVADDVTMSVSGKAKGSEDTEIPLTISATSSDPSETINVTISNIPVGATIHWAGGDFTATAGNTSLTMPDFNGTNAGPVSITPPLQWSGSMPLIVEAQSVDGGDTSDIYSRPITVEVVGVADAVTITALQPGDVGYVVVSEADMDGGGRVNLADLIAGWSTDETTRPGGDDGSETASFRVTGLADGFSLTGATLISGNATGSDRVWSVSQAQLDNVEISTPANFSGTAQLQIQGISTERDGDSRTSPATTLSFQVTPSVEAEANTGNSALVEDLPSALNLQIAHQNGDTDEHLGDVWILAAEVSTSGYTLLLNGVALDTLPTVDVGGVAYVQIAADDVPNLQVQGGAHLDGELGTFNFLYEVIDDSYGGTASGAEDREVKSGQFTISATAVTDDITLELADIDGGNPVNGETDNIEMAAAGVVTVNLTVGSDDTDGSECVVRVIVEGVPDGVTVVGGEQVAPGVWIVMRSDSINNDDGINVPVQFLVSSDAGNLDEHEITMTVQVKDRGDTVAYETVDADRKQESITWKLTTDFTGDGAAPAIIEEWTYNDEGVREDTPFALSDVIDAEVTVQTPGQNNIFTVTLTDLPSGTTVAGMTQTSVNGVPTWTATVVVPPDGDADVALQGLLDGITITPPLNSNDNNAPGEFSFNATLSTSAGGGTESETIDKGDMVIPVEPVTDPAVVTVVAPDLGENPTGSIPVTITVDHPADGSFGSIVDGVMYVTVDAGGGNAGGTLWHNGEALVPDGSGVYAVPVEAGVPVELEYTPPAGTSPGDVTFNVTVDTQEEGAANSATGTGLDTATIVIVNNGVTVERGPSPIDDHVEDTERSGSTPADAIVISDGGITTTLVDSDSSETITGVMLEGVPVGFLVYVDGALATNAGGDGTSNVWVLKNGPLDGTEEISVLPPPHWSGTVDGMNLLVESGETTLSEKRIDTVSMGELVVTPVADGLTIAPTHSFGREGQIIRLNLNATMVDPTEAAASQVDASTETTTVVLSGMGEGAIFYLGSEAIDASRISYDPAVDGSYTITGLTQAELGQLGFRQVNAELEDQGDAAGLQIAVEAWTVESDGGAESARVTESITLNLQNQRPTGGDDQLLWTGNAINGLGGDDVVHLGYGQDLTGAQLAAQLSNIEGLDLSASGANAITGLTPEQAASILGDSSNILTIDGDNEDEVTLGGAWTYTEVENGYGVYTATVGSDTYLLHVHASITQPQDELAGP